jgi:glucose-6-phosphate 1-dehydrogenase
MAVKSVEPLLFVIFGATGDLSRRSLLPALYRIAQKGLFQRSLILGVARSRDTDTTAFRATVRDVVASIDAAEHAAANRWCEECVYYHGVGNATENDFRHLAGEIESIEGRHSLPGNRIFYLALPPDSFFATIEGIGQTGLNRSRGWTRLVVEKPFGRDLESARELDALLHRVFDESQVFRIDHYLGKETVQNLLVLRFANAFFENAWNRDRVDNVQITVGEQLGMEGRAGYYDKAGALRDMVQNHLTQVLTHVAMEVPAVFEAEAIRDEQVKVLQSIKPLTSDQVVYGQYTAGKIGDQSVAGYREEPGVRQDSTTETALALKLEIANWRWQGVPFYLRTGKRLARHVAKIVLNFRCAPVSIFAPFDPPCSVHANVFEITMQQDEGFDLHFEVKQPGQPVRIRTESLHFRYAEAFSALPDAYETLLLDVMIGDQTLFVRSDWVSRSWKLYDSVLKQPPPVHEYRAGTWGPPEFDQLLLRGGHNWFPL